MTEETLQQESAQQALNDLREEVLTSGGVLAIPMERLRNLHGYGRLGKYVTEEISFSLHGRGLGHVPAPLPLSQNEYVLVFQLGSGVARVVDAVLSHGPESADTLRELVSDQANLTLAKIRDLVCP
jgi:hypothetical protein